MREFLPKQFLSFWRFFLHPLTFGLFVLLADQSVLTHVSSFDPNSSLGSKNPHRFPASASNQVIKFDCLQLKDAMELSTPFETIRLEASNCGPEVTVNNSQLNFALSTFPTGQKTFSTEYAYLVKGENNFAISFKDKSYSLKIVRF